MTYEGWENYETWNVSLWINNDEPTYRGAVEFMQDYKGKTPYSDFVLDSGLYAQKTVDDVKWADPNLNYSELDDMMRELAPEGARKS